jgi:hypothetical protein
MARIEAAARIEVVVRIEVVGDGRDQTERGVLRGLQIDRLHPSFGVALACGNALWRSRVNAPQIVFG